MIKWLARPFFRLLQIEPTMLCNLRCVMCPWHEMRSKDAIMAWETFLRIIPSLKRTKEVDLTGGGEPLLHPRLVEMVGLAKEQGCRVGFSTNATLLKEEAARDLIENGLDWIAYSIEGVTAETYEGIRRGASWREVLANMETFSAMRMEMGGRAPFTMVFFVMMKENVHEVPELVELCLRLSIDRLVLKNQDVITRIERDRYRLFSWEPLEEKEVRALLASATERARRGGLEMVVYPLKPVELEICEQDPLHTAFINWEGFVSPCITLAYASKRVFRGQVVSSPIHRFGNVNDMPLEEIWGTRGYVEFRALSLIHI